MTIYNKSNTIMEKIRINVTKVTQRLRKITDEGRKYYFTVTFDAEKVMDDGSKLHVPGPMHIIVEFDDSDIKYAYNTDKITESLLREHARLSAYTMIDDRYYDFGQLLAVCNETIDTFAKETR